MKPANLRSDGELLASIENTLAKIEKCDIPELNAGPNAFSEWIKQSEAIEVGWGWMKTATGDQVIFTQHMSDCSAIVLCTHFDEQTGIYEERSLMHILGSWVGDSYGIEKSLELVKKASESRSKPRCIIALGSKVTSEHFATVANQEVETIEGRVVKPFVMLQELCDTFVLERKSGIAVRSDGAYVVM